MKIFSLKIKALLILLLVFTCNVHAQDSAVETLSPELQALLNKEMFAIQEAMMAMIPAFSAGDNQEIASIAAQIKNTFIMKQSLTTEQREELGTKLPEGFLNLDKQFHQNAASLEAAAKSGDFDKVSYYLKQMTEACYACHSQYAMHKFRPLLAPTEK